MKDKLKNWWQRQSKADKAYLIILVLIVSLALFLRTYNLKDSQQFLGDQGRDALIVAKILKEHDLVFIGPVTSVGNMYLGPLYYYWMLPWLAISYPSPMGPVYAMAILGTLAVFLTYFLGKDLVGRLAALIGSLILAIMPAAVMLSRFSWNPNPAPLVSMVMIWATWKALSNKKYWLLVAASFSILIQLHYVTLLTLPAAGLVWLWQLVGDLKLKRQPVRNQALVETLKYTVLSMMIFLGSLLPLILFDLKHNFLNAHAFISIFTHEGFTSGKETSFLGRLMQALKETQGRSLHIFYELTIGKERALNQFLLTIIIGWFGYLIYIKKLLKRHPGFSIVLVYLLVGIFGLSFYTQSVFDHYVAYLYPVSALALGLALAEIIRLQKLVGLIVISGFIFLESLFLARIHPWVSAGLTLDEIEKTAKLIKDKVDDAASYNVVLLDEAKDLYGMKYRYYLYTLDKPVASPEKASQVDELVVIDERIKRDRPFDELNIYEIEVFPHKNPVNHLVGPDGQDIWVLKRD